MLCSEVQLYRSGEGFEDVKPLPCNRWSCEYCQPKRRRRLMAIAASGKPNKMLTLTVTPSIGASPLDRRNLLHDAWKRLVKRMLRQFALPIPRRWALKTKRRSFVAAAVLAVADEKTPQRGCDAIHYMAFLEATEAGEPHLHILLRCPYVPQDWLAEQLGEMIASPVCDIRQIKDARTAVYYVTKYVTKAPAQFGNTKRYWVSRGYSLDKRDQVKEQPGQRLAASVRRLHYSEWIAQISDRLRRSDLLLDGWVRVWDRRSSGLWPEPRLPAEDAA